MRETLYQVSAPHFTAGVLVYSGVVTKAAPILKWAIRQDFTEFRKYAKSKGWTVARVSREEKEDELLKQD
jgi:hypothetical protein